MKTTTPATTQTLVMMNTYYIPGIVFWISHTLTHIVFSALCKVGTVFIFMVVSYLLKAAY